MTTCLVVLGIIGSMFGMTCKQAPPPPTAQCWQIAPSMTICVVEDATDLPVFPSPYNPYLGGINCDSDCSTVATMDHADWMFNNVVACPKGWIGNTSIILHGHEWLCLDTGTAITVDYRKMFDAKDGFYFGWAIVIDFMLWDDDQWWVYLPQYEWAINYHADIIGKVSYLQATHVVMVNEE